MSGLPAIIFSTETRVNSGWDRLLSNISEEGTSQRTVHVLGDELAAGKTKAFGTLATGKTRCRQVHARAGSQYPLVKHVLPAGFHKLYRYAYRLHGSGRTHLHVRLCPGFCRPGGSGASGRRFFPIHAPFLLALGADMPTRSGSDERATTTAANDRTK